MIVYYDILSLDGDSLLGVRHSERRKILSNLIKCQLGWAELAKHEIIDFGSPLGASNLRNVFAKTIVNKQEGLVLKADEPYFNFSVPERPWSGRCIKLKKEYIGSFGDVGDFAVVGAGYDSAKASHYDIAGLKWTHFYIGCLGNKHEVERWVAMPEFTVVNVVELNQTQLRSIIHCGNPIPIHVGDNDKFQIIIPAGISTNPPMASVFTQPLVVDLRCFSFDKVGNTGFWSPRFPVVSRVHLDRDYMEALSFQELQEKAKEATMVQEQPDSQEILEWIARLEAADPRGIAVDAVSQQTVTTMPTPSPRRSTQSSSQSWPLSPTLPRTLARSATQPAISPATHFQAVRGPPPAQPRPTLITPPTSSDPLPSLLEQKEKKQPHKRNSPTASQTTQASKRRRPSEDKHRLAADSPFPKPCHPKPARRKPFADLDVNSSQRSSSSSQPTKPRPSNKGRMSRQPEVIDLTSSPCASPEAAPSKSTSARESPNSSQGSGDTTLEVLEQSLNDAKEASNPKEPASLPAHDPGQSFASAQGSALDAEQNGASQAVTLNSQNSDYVNLFMSGWDHAINDDDYPSQSSPPATASQTSKYRDATPSRDVSETKVITGQAPAASSRPILRSACKYAGSRCHFSKTEVLLAPQLVNASGEIGVLLKDHNIEDAITDIKAWLADENKRPYAHYDQSPQDAGILLVDTLQYPSESEALTKEIKEALSTWPEAACRCIIIYDWRMLKHLTIHEDEGVTKKYYDGFRNPFDRWYAGML